MPTIMPIKPAAIEAKSFEIIEKEFQEQTGLQEEAFPVESFRVIQRVIHATGDFAFARAIKIHPEAIQRAVAALKAGKNIVTDVNMVATGINKTLLKQWGGEVICKIADPDIAVQATQAGLTRSEAAIRSAIDQHVGIIAIGNAPTALIETINFLRTNDALRRSLVVIGVPVGFVNAAESKELLHASDICHITSLGRKGGSPVAAAMVNAIMKLAAQ